MLQNHFFAYLTKTVFVPCDEIKVASYATKINSGLLLQILFVGTSHELKLASHVDINKLRSVLQISTSVPCFK